MTAVRCYSSGFSPAREVLFLDDTGPEAAHVNQREITTEMALATISKNSGVPMDQLTTSSFDRIKNLEQALESSIIGQPEARQAIIRRLRFNAVNLRDKRKPIGSFLFAGPTATGKTETCKKLAEFYFPAPDDLIRIDMSEYGEKHSVSRLLGSPPGYEGHAEGGQLVNKVRRKPYSVVLFDEIEKAHPDVLNVLLQILDEGVATDAQGNTAYFNNAIVVLTSNTGAMEGSKRGLGFGQNDPNQQNAHRKDQFMKAIRAQFPPELLGRLDDIIIFNQLTFEDNIAIAGIHMHAFALRLQENTGINLEYDQSVCIQIATAISSNPFGVRGLGKHIEDGIEDKIAEQICLGMLTRDNCVEIIANPLSPTEYLLEIKPLVLTAPHKSWWSR